MAIWLSALLILLPQESLQDLDSPDPTVARRAIEAAIRKADEKALESAAKVSRGARFALAEVRAHMRFGEAYPQPVSFTLQVRDHPAIDVVDKLATTLGKRFEIDGGRESLAKMTISLDLREATLLETMDALGKAIGRGYDIRWGTVRISKSASPVIGPAFYWRHFRISFDSLAEYREVLGSGGPDHASTLWGNLFRDGQCRIAGTRGLRIDEVTDDSGRAIAADNDLSNGWYGNVGKYHFGHPVVGKLKSVPDATVKRISMRGAWVFMIPEGPRFEDLPLDDRTRKIESDNVSIRIEDVANDGASIKATGRIADWRKPHVFPLVSDFQLVGKDGRLLAAKGRIDGPVECAVLSLEFDLPAGFKAASLKVRVFRSIGDHECPFEIKDLPVR